MPPAVLAAFVIASGYSPLAPEQRPQHLAAPELPDTGPRPDLADVAARVVARTEEFRKAEGRGATRVDPKLLAAARAFAGYMARTDLYAHTADGSTPGMRAARHGYEMALVLENIAHAHDSRGFTAEKQAAAFVTGWKESPGHRRNMLDPDVTDTAVAVARSEATGRYYAVQMFGRPAGAAVTFRVENRSGEAVTYTADGKPFTLEPRVTRTHMHGRPPEVVFTWPGGKTAGVRPAAGDRFVVTKEGDEFRVAAEKDAAKE